MVVCQQCAGPLGDRRITSLTRYCSDRCKRQASGARYHAQAKPADIARRQARARSRWYAQYGVDETWYQETLAAQGGVCANDSCGRTPDEEGKRLAVDHCHATGLARGILCEKCNRALGMLADDPARVRGLARYLERG